MKRAYRCLIAGALALTGCAVKVQMPTAVVISPEARGGFLSGSFSGHLYSTPEVTVADNTSSAAPNTDPSIDRARGLGAGAELGLLPSLDFYLVSGVDAPNIFGVKYQIFGSHASAAKAGNFSLAVAGGFSLGEASEKPEAGGVVSDVSVEYSGWDALVLAGYRPWDRILLFAGPRVTRINLDNEIVRTSGGVSTVTADTEGEGETVSVTVGARADLGDHAYVAVQGAMAKTIWERKSPSALAAEEFEDATMAFTFGFMW